MPISNRGNDEPSPTRRRSLKLLVAGAVLAPVAVFLVYSWISYTAAFASAEARAQHISKLLEEHAEKVFETISLALRQVDERIKGMDWHSIETSRELWEEIRQIQGSLRQLGSLFVVDSSGRVPLTTRVYPNPRDDFSDRDYYFEQKKQDRGLYLGQTYIGKISNIPIFNFSIRRSSKDGSFDGVIGSSAFVEYFESFYSTAGPSDDNFSVLLLRSDGHILARHPRVGVGANLPDSIVTKLTAQPAVLTYEKSPFDGRERLYSVIKVGSFPAFIAYSIDTYSISKHWWNEVAIAGLLTGAVSSLMLWLGLLALRHAKIEHEFADQLRRSTAELRAEMDKRKAAETSLMQAQRLDAVGRLAGGIAHDFNNLLMIVKGNLTLAKKRVDSLAVQKHLQSAEHAADRGADLTRHLLSFSRGQTLNPVVIDLKSTFTRARSWIAVAISDSLDFELSLPPDLWNIRADKSELEAALLNLIVNARDALRGNGKIILRASNVRLEELEGLEEGPGEYVNVSVEDNGPGMAADVLSRVYEPFFTKRSGQGLWARLEPSTRFYAAIWWKDCHQIGGREGNSHRPLFPPLQRGGGSFPELRTACFNTMGISQTALVVEDNSEVRKLTSAMLDELGYTVLLARNGVEATALLSAGEQIDFLISDYQMPGSVNGAELGALAEEIKPELKVLLCTASPDVKSRYRTLMKPFTTQDLAAALRQLERDYASRQAVQEALAGNLP